MNNFRINRVSIIFCVLVLFIVSCSQQSTTESSGKITSAMKLSDVKHFNLKGIIGEALEASINGRLTHFITSPESESIKLFGKMAQHETKGWRGWQGEHAGKWLYAATKAAYRTENDTLKNRIYKIADYLISTQRKNGYIGTYVDSLRIYENPVNPVMTWDVWNSAYLMQGFIEMYKSWGEQKYLDATERIARLMIATFGEGKKDIGHSGYYGGLAANGIMDQFIELYNITGNKSYIDFAKYCVTDLETRPGTEILTRNLQKYDAAQIDHGKMYEMIRVYVGIAKLYRATGNDTLLTVINNAWNEIRNYHLSPTGAPWGGITGGHRDLEMFNIRYMFSPYGYSETCAFMEWLRFNKELFKITGDIKYMNELEKTTYNAVPGAQFPDGLSWTYHSHPNGERTQCSKFACCSSSGPIVLEEIPEIVYSKNKKGVYINLFINSTYKINYKKDTFTITQNTNYPWEGKVNLTIKCNNNNDKIVYLRIPEWAKNSTITYKNKKIQSNGNEYIKLNLSEKNNVINVNMPLKWRIFYKTKEYNYKGYYIFNLQKYFYLKRGAVVYAASVKDSYEKPANLRFLPNDVVNGLILKNIDNKIPEYTINDTIEFLPYFMAANRQPGNFKATWLRIK